MRPCFVDRLVTVVLFVLSLGFCLGLTACGSDDDVSGASKTLSWTAVPDSSILGYKVYWGTESGRYDASADAGPDPTYTIGGLSAGTMYFFAVSAYSSGGESALSDEVSSVVE